MRVIRPERRGLSGVTRTDVSLQAEIMISAGSGDSASAMALNGGVAHQGGVCSAITGAALAIGRLAAQRIPDHERAKRVARSLVQTLIADFEDRLGTTQCPQLMIGFDLRGPRAHKRFIDSGVWRTRCAFQVEFSMGELAGLEATRGGECRRRRARADATMRWDAPETWPGPRFV